jgi:hypothetical protein
MLGGKIRKKYFCRFADFHAPERTKKVKSEYAPWITENMNIEEIF